MSESDYTHTIQHDRYSRTMIRDNGNGTITHVLITDYPVGNNRGNNNWGHGPTTERGTVEEFARGYSRPVMAAR